MVSKTNGNHIIIKVPSKGESMIPIIKHNCLLEINISKSTRCTLGDIIVVIRNGVFIAHRIIGIKRKKGRLLYLLKGDNNSKSDGYLDKKCFVGRVEKIIHKSYRIDLLDIRNSSSKYVFVGYSLLIGQFKKLLTYRNLSKIGLAKLVYKTLTQ